MMRVKEYHLWEGFSVCHLGCEQKSRDNVLNGGDRPCDTFQQFANTSIANPLRESTILLPRVHAPELEGHLHKEQLAFIECLLYIRHDSGLIIQTHSFNPHNDSLGSVLFVLPVCGRGN